MTRRTLALLFIGIPVLWAMYACWMVVLRVGYAYQWIKWRLA